MRFAAIGLAALAVGAPHAGPDGPAPERPATEVGMSFNAFTPPRVDVVTGDVVRWENGSVRPHTVTADDGRFDSGRMASGTRFEQRVAAPGVLTYHCSLHAGMVGEIRAQDVLLRAPSAPATPGRPFPLGGRTALPAGTPLTIEAETGAGFAPVTTTPVGADGTFGATITPSTTTTYRAVAGDKASEPVQVLALDREVTASVRRHGRRVMVDVAVTPASPGQTVVLQLDLKRRFGWWPVQVARLDRRSRARFEMPLRSSPRARVLLTLPDRATTLASSGPLSTRGR